LRTRWNHLIPFFGAAFQIALIIATLLAESRAQGQQPFDAESSKKPATALPAALQSELIALRDAALVDDYAYQQVAHLT
jgi:hypothetical protein